MFSPRNNAGERRAKRSRKRKHLLDEYKLMSVRSVHTPRCAAPEAASRTWETDSSLPVPRDHCPGHSESYQTPHSSSLLSVARIQSCSRNAALIACSFREKELLLLLYAFPSLQVSLVQSREDPLHPRIAKILWISRDGNYVTLRCWKVVTRVSRFVKIVGRHLEINETGYKHLSIFMELWNYSVRWKDRRLI